MSVDKVVEMCSLCMKNENIMNYVGTCKNIIFADTSMKENLNKLTAAVQGDEKARMELLSDDRPLPFNPAMTYAQMHALVISTSEKLIHGRFAGNVEIAVSAIVILVALIIGVLIMTQVKGTAMDVAVANNDTEAQNLISSVYSTGKSGLIILALSVLVLGAVVIIGYLRGMSSGR